MSFSPNDGTHAQNVRFSRRFPLKPILSRHLLYRFGSCVRFVAHARRAARRGSPRRGSPLGAQRVPERTSLPALVVPEGFPVRFLGHFGFFAFRDSFPFNQVGFFGGGFEDRGPRACMWMGGRTGFRPHLLVKGPFQRGLVLKPKKSRPKSRGIRSNWVWGKLCCLILVSR